MTALKQLRDLEAAIAAASARQRELREAKETAARDVAAKREALVEALADDLDGSPAATAAQKGLQAAEKRAGEPWTERVEAAGRLVEQARRKRGVYVANYIDALMAEMAAPAVKWPDRAREALEALYAVAREFNELGMPIERLAQEAGLTAVRVPDNPLERFTSELNRMREVSLPAPVPATVAISIDPLDAADEAVREVARARFVDERAA